MIRLAYAALLALGLAASPAFAQTAPKIFISSTGNDADDGSRAFPKRSFQAAHDAVAAAGEIVVLDTAGYGALNINKSVAVVVPPGVTGFVTVTSTASGATGISIDAGNAGVVTLNGLIVEGPGTSSANNGIKILSAETVVIENTVIRNFREGLYARTRTPLTLIVKRSAVRDTVYGIDLENEAGTIGLVRATISDTELTKNTTAFYIYSNAQNSVSATITRCSVTNSTRGFYINGGAQNTFSRATIDASTFDNLDTVFTVANGGKAFSRGNNILDTYTALGPAPTTALTF